MKIRNKFSPRVAYIAMSADDGRTQQHFADEVDINRILAKYRKTGVIEHVKRAQERYGDFTDLANYATNLDKVAKAKQSFEMLPAELRNHFKNSIQGFFEFVKDPENIPQMQKWGFFEKKPNEPGDSTLSPAKPAEPAPQSTKAGNIKKTPAIKNQEDEG